MSETKIINPTAFPLTNDVYINRDEHGSSFGSETGMSLRVYEHDCGNLAMQISEKGSAIVIGNIHLTPELLK